MHDEAKKKHRPVDALAGKPQSSKRPDALARRSYVPSCTPYVQMSSDLLEAAIAIKGTIVRICPNIRACRAMRLEIAYLLLDRS